MGDFGYTQNDTMGYMGNGGYASNSGMASTCANCMNVFADDAAFCRKCGVQRPVLPEAPAEAPVITGPACAHCGNIYADDAVFCRKCGAERPEGRIATTDEFDFHLSCTILQWFLTLVLLYLSAGLNPLDWGKKIVDNLTGAFTTPFDGIFAWALWALGLVLVFIGIVGFGTNVMSWNPKFDGKYFALTTLCIFLEETWFRAALLSDDTNGTQAVIAWIIWCLYHQDLIHYYGTMPGLDNRSLFRDPVFMLIAAALGLACIATFLGTSGCLIASTTVHVLIVWAWVFVFGGEGYVEKQE